MKRIAILSCLSATQVCTGASCFYALNQRLGAFDIYPVGGLEVIAFLHCNGCGVDHGTDEGFREKLIRLYEMHPDAVHVGKCTWVGDVYCETIKGIVEELSLRNIEVIWGTH